MKFKIVFYCFLLTVSSSLCFSFAEEGVGARDTFEEGCFSFSLEGNIDVKKLNKKFNLRKIPNYENYINEFLFYPDPKKQLYGILSVLFKRVQDILNMYPKEIKKIGIHLFENKHDMRDYLKKINGSEEVLSYDRKNHIIYLYAAKADEYALAHLLALAIIDQYFLIPPPQSIQDILASHCDVHLRDSSYGQKG